MNRVMIIADTGSVAGALQERLARYLTVDGFPATDLPEGGPGPLTIVDVDLRNPATVKRLKTWLKCGTSRCDIAVCVNRHSSLESIQAYALGATCLLPRPVDPERVASKIRSGAGQICQGPSKIVDEFFDCISAGVDALQAVFAAAIEGEAPDMKALDDASADVVDTVEEIGLKQWLEIVHGHHSRTYQHSLIVTGVATSFAHHLGFGRSDRKRLATAGLLHDIGKACIPVEILEKPAELTGDETKIMRTHPEEGYRALRSSLNDVEPEMLDLVLHHHEYLDGSGYPHGLTAPDISDLVRVITIADVYGALVERRAYKPPLSGSEAYGLLEKMGPKLDRALVREFGALAHDII